MALPPRVVVFRFALGDEVLAVEMIAKQLDLLQRLAFDPRSVRADNAAADDHEPAVDARAGREPHVGVDRHERSRNPARDRDRPVQHRDVACEHG